MGTPERLHRPDPERTGPIRNATTYLRDAPSGDAAHHPARTPDAPDAAEGAVAHGVRLGYKVIEEQILHGRLLAQRLGKATSKLGAGGSGEVNVLVERVLHLYKDIGTLCVDTLETLARSPAIRSGLARAAQAAQPPQDGAGGAAGAESALGTGFAIEVASARRTQVTLDLRLRPGRFAPRVHALHAADPSVAPLTGVSFDMDPAHPEPMLRIEVPDNQPAATYTGVVVDSASNEPRGTLSVRLLP